MTTHTPGQFARITVTEGCKKVRAVRTSDDDWAGDDGYTYHNDELTEVRLLVTLDLRECPYERDAILAALRTNDPASRYHQNDWLADQIEEQTKPPRIPEPEWGQCVEAGVDAASSPGRREWLRIGKTRSFWHDGLNTYTDWSGLVDPVLIRPGIEDGAS